MLRLIGKEALAYLQLGLSTGRYSGQLGSGELGTLFVPGVAGHPSQFASLQASLTEAGFDAFDAHAYRLDRALPQLAAELRARLEDSSTLPGSERVLLVGHSLGGVLCAAALQLLPELPARVAGLVTICSPLHGTRASRFAVRASLRQLRPDASFITQLIATQDRLLPLRGRVLTIGVATDQLVHPASSAYLEGATQLHLDGVAHAGSLLDRRTHAAVVELAATLARAD